jgi:type I restriction enzyme S subunit
MARISEVAMINPRMSKELRSDIDRKVAFLPMAAVKENGQFENVETKILGEVSKGYTYFERGDIIFAKITPCFENGKATCLDNLPLEVGFGSTEFHVLRGNDGVDGRYLFHMIWNPTFRFLAARAMTGAAGQKRVPTPFVKDFQIPMPPLSEQKRIAAILDKADAICRKRQDAIVLADTFLRSVFLKMFGDPVANPMGWDEVYFGEVLSGKMSNGLSPSSTGSYPGVVYTLSSITGVTFNEAAKKEALFDKKPSQYYAQQHSFMICRGNGNKNLVGRGKFPIGDFKTTMVPDTIITAPVETSSIAPKFLEMFWANKYVRRQIEKASRTTNGIHKINQGALNKTMILVPPIVMQNEYQEIAHNVQSYIAKISSNVEETLFSSLQQRAFRGDL